MSSVTVKTRGGGDAGTVDLVDDIFGIEPNTAVLHQVVTAQLAARRAGTQSTKTRAEKRGGGAKPWKQKGTGRARQGSTRSPQWRGGGVALGPKPRSYAQKTPRKMVRLALRSALSDRAAEDKVVVIEGWNFDAPRTKDALSALEALGLDGRVLVVAPRDDVNTWKSFANLSHVHVLAPGELNAYDILVSDVVVFTTDTLPTDEPVEAEATTAEERTDESGSAEGGADTASAEGGEDTASAEGGEDIAEAPEAESGSASSAGGEDTAGEDIGDEPTDEPGSSSSAGGDEQ